MEFADLLISQLFQHELLDSVQQLRIQFDAPVPDSVDEQRLHRIARALVDLSGLVQRCDGVVGAMDHEQRRGDLLNFLNTDRIFGKIKRHKLKFTTG